MAVNYLYIANYDSRYYITEKIVQLPRLLDIIDGKATDNGYNLFRFYTKTNKEKQLFFDVFRSFLINKKRHKSNHQSVLWLVDSPRMTHLIVNEMVEAELLGYDNILVMCDHNVDANFFRDVKDVSLIIRQLQELIKDHRCTALITPCVNKVHNSILANLKIKRIGIQHGYGTWVEKKILDNVDIHFNFGEISNNEFNNPKSTIAGYSPTKLFRLYPGADEHYILYLTQGAQFTNKKNIVDQLGLLRLQTDTGLSLVIKEHNDAKNEFKGLPIKAVYNEPEANTVELIRKASLIITSWSGAGVEALFFNKPTIILDTQKNSGRFYRTSGLVVPMNYNLLEQRVDFLLQGSKIDITDYKRRINFKEGKLASETILKTI